MVKINISDEELEKLPWATVTYECPHCHYTAGYNYFDEVNFNDHLIICPKCNKLFKV